MRRGLSVIQGDADHDLQDYPSNSFDYVVLSQTLQATYRPRTVLEHMVRIGKHAIVSFPNFAHWRMRIGLLTGGRMPITPFLGHTWYDTPNIHFCTVLDFIALCDAMNVTIERSLTLDRLGRPVPAQSARRSGEFSGRAGAVFVATQVGGDHGISAPREFWIARLAIGLGCNPFGNEVDAALAARIVGRALDLGVTYFDTADSYFEGRSEDYLGRALQARRGDAIIATKFGNPVEPGSRAGASRRDIIAACEASLRRLKTDYIDVYQVHTPDRFTPLEETMRALDDLVRAGKVRYLGCSNFYEWEIVEGLAIADKFNLTPFVIAQDFYNLLYRDIEKRMSRCASSSASAWWRIFRWRARCSPAPIAATSRRRRAAAAPVARASRPGTPRVIGTFKKSSPPSPRNAVGRCRDWHWRGCCRAR